MATSLPCPHCQAPLRHDETTAGKRVRCPACKQVTALPPLPPPQQAASIESNESVRDADYYASLKGSFQSFENAAQHSRPTVQSFLEMVIFIFDPTFSRYLTPWIVRFTWAAVIVITFMLISAYFMGELSNLLWGFFPSSQDVGPRPRFEPQSQGETAEAIRNLVLPILRWGLFATVQLLGLLWTRVCLEVCVVLFDISNSLKRLEKLR